jgi:glutathione peroxidase-family protein
MLEADVKGDYQKFIINKEGKVVGVFAGSISPLTEPFIKAITVNL